MTSHPDGGLGSPGPKYRPPTLFGAWCRMAALAAFGASFWADGEDATQCILVAILLTVLSIDDTLRRAR